MNVQYRGSSIIEVGLRLARGGSYITSTQNEPLIKNINNVVDLKQWDYNLEKEIDYSPFYAFKCHTYMPILFLFPQYFLDNFIASNGGNSFYEYYFEPTGKNGMVFFQFFHNDFDTGMKAKKEMEAKMKAQCEGLPLHWRQSTPGGSTIWTATVGIRWSWIAAPARPLSAWGWNSARPSPRATA